MQLLCRVEEHSFQGLHSPFNDIFWKETQHYHYQAYFAFISFHKEDIPQSWAR